MALATCAELPGGDEDAEAIVAALARIGIDAASVVWDEPRDWGAFDLVVPRSTWDYAERLDAFLAWAERVPRLVNPLPVVRWSADKQRYLADLAEAGVPVVPTRFLDPGAAVELPAAPFVVKPAVSAGGRSSARFAPGEEAQARALVDAIHASGRAAMVQPYLESAARAGETAVIVLGGALSHAVSRRARLPGAGGPETGFYLPETIEGLLVPRPDERAVAERALACVPGAALPLYGRVDLVRDDEGKTRVLELELVEPSLYLGYAPGAVERLAAAIAAALDTA